MMVLPFLLIACSAWARSGGRYDPYADNVDYNSKDRFGSNEVANYIFPLFPDALTCDQYEEFAEISTNKTMPVSEIEMRLKEWAEINNVAEVYSEYLKRADEERKKFYGLVRNVTAVAQNFFNVLEEIVENKNDSFVIMQKKLMLLLKSLTKPQKKVIKKISSIFGGENVLSDFRNAKFRQILLLRALLALIPEFFTGGGYRGGLSDNDIHPIGDNRMDFGNGYDEKHELWPHGDGHENSIFDNWNNKRNREKH